jgi:uncharacterized protein
VGWRGLSVLNNNIGCAAAGGVPAIQLEVGGGGKLQAEHVALEVAGLENMLRVLDMLPGRARALGGETMAYGMTVISAELGGFFRPEFEIGGRVVAGQLLGTFSDAFGEVIGEARCPSDGIILMSFTTPIRNSGEPVCIIGRLDDPRQ